MKKIITLTILFIMAFNAKAQVSEGGLPPTFTFENSLRSSIGVVEVPITFDVQQLIKEDEESVANGSPTRVGMLIPLHVEMKNEGVWSQLPDGRLICQLNISAQGAKAISLYYDKFYIPKGGKLFIYNGEKTHVLGAYTETTNPFNKSFATEYLAGDFLTLEYVEPKGGTGDDQPEIVISELGYGYNHIHIRQETSLRAGYKTSYPCMVDVNCSPEGDNWQNQKKGVAKILYRLNTGQYFCSGSLVNNTAQDLALYWLTADHCFRGQTVDRTFQDMIFYFQYENPSCGNPLAKEPVAKTITGAQYLVGINHTNGSDGVLLKINGSYTADYNFFWNGWDRRDLAPSSGVGIHHPEFDVKKISTFSTPAYSATWKSGSGNGAADAHWGISFAPTANGHSITQGGSSGSPLFNQDGRVVGTLTGGNATCDFTDGKTYYGKMSSHWNRPDDNGKTMAEYLDPGNTGAEFMDGRYADGKAVANFNSDRTSVYASEEVHFIDNSYKANTYAWEFAGAEPAVSAERNPVVRYVEPGVHEVKLTINAGTSDEAIITKSAYITCTEKSNICDRYAIAGTGTNTSQFPLGFSDKQIFDVSLYTPGEISPQAGTISNIAWKSAASAVKPQTVYVYLKETDEMVLAPNTWTNEIAGAKLVYRGSDIPWKNDAGWISFSLDSLFQYSGNKNLKVIVRTIAKSEPLASNECYYSNVSDSHMQWVSSRSTLPTTNGTVNANRPNIRLGFGDNCPAILPVASFTPQYQINVFKADFEGEDFFVENGWTIERFGASPGKWQQDNYVYSFSGIDPTSKYSAMVRTDLSYVVGTRMISPSVTVPQGGILDFYAAYSGGSTGLTFNISTDNGATWTELWTPGKLLDSGLPTRWAKQTFDLSAYAGQQVKLGWLFEGKNTAAVAIDQVRLYYLNQGQEPIHIHEGETVHFRDLSQGPPVSWNWTLDGATIAASTQQHPSVQYLQAGTYDVTLQVKNNEGTDEKTIAGLIIVDQQTPQADFSVAGGYKRKSNYGSYIPTGGSVDFTDNSLHLPRNWEWTFANAQTSTSTRENPSGILYPTEGLFPVKLKVNNPLGGNNELLVENFIQVGGKDSIWNMPKNDSGTHVYPKVDGFITGTNKYMADVVDSYSERFDAPVRPGEITSVEVLFHVASRISGTIPVSICEDEHGIPGKVLAQTSLDVNSINPDGYTTITFPHPVGVSRAFHVVLDGFNTSFSSTVKFAVAIKSSKNQENGPGTAYMYYNKDNFNGWVPISYILPYNLSLNVVPVFQYATLETDITAVNDKNEGNIDFPVAVTSNITWKVLTNDLWIHLNNTSGTRDGSFSIKCLSNPGDQRTGVVTIEGGGYKKSVIVRQAGVSPTHLMASLSAGNTKNIEVSWDAPAPNIAKTYFDDIESHPVFTVNSPGEIGWSYIDGDNSTTYSFTEIQYPKANQRMAFVVMDPSKTTPDASSLPELLAHSGNQYLACFNSNTGVTNDWIISPNLNYAENFRFSFWAKSETTQFGPERIRVAYSTEGKAMADFTHVVSEGSYVQVPAVWTKYEYVIPATAKYVAVNCVSNEAFILMLDNLFIGIGQEPESAAIRSGNVPESAVVLDRNAANRDEKKTKNEWTRPSMSGNFHSSSIGNAIPLRNSSETTNENEVVLRWDNGENIDGLGVNFESTFEPAVLFETHDLLAYHRSTLIAVEFYPYLLPGNTGSATYTIKVRQNGVLVLSQPVANVVFNQFNRVALTTPLVIDAAKSLQIGYEVHDVGGKYPAGYDAGPALMGKGNLVSTDGGFSFSLLTDFGLNANWNIAAIIEKREKEGLYYKVYRNDETLERASATNYTDENLSLGEYCYKVTAVYDSDLETNSSNVSCVTVVNSSISDQKISEKIQVYPNPVKSGHDVTVRMDLSPEELNNTVIQIIDMQGRTLEKAKAGKILNTVTMPSSAGSYILRVQIGESAFVQFKITVN